MSFSSTRDSRTLSVSNICSSIFSSSASSTFCCSSPGKGPFPCTKHSKLKALELSLSCPRIAKLGFPPFVVNGAHSRGFSWREVHFFNVLHKVKYQELLGNLCFALVHNGSSFLTGCRQVIQEFWILNLLYISYLNISIAISAFSPFAFLLSSIKHN